MPTFVRDQTRHAIKKRVEAHSKGFRQNVGVIGPLGLGKTHLLKAVFKDCAADNDLICVYIQAETFDYEQLIDRWIGALLAGYLRSQSKGVHVRELTDLLSVCENLIPRTVQASQQVRKHFRKGRDEELVSELFALSGILSQECGKKILMTIDEFQEISKLPVADAFVLFGKEIMVETDTLYLVSSSKPERAREIFRDKLSLLFGNFEVLELRPFEFQETVDFISRHFPKTYFTEEQKKFFISMTNGEPLYLDLLIERLKLYLSSESEQIISDHLIFTAFHEELFARHGRIALMFEKQLSSALRGGKDNVPYLKTLMAVSEGSHKLTAISSAISRRQGETKKILQKLIQEDCVSRKGDFYMIEDPLFRYWLREVFKRRSCHYFPEEKRMSEEFLQTLRENMEKICHLEKKEGSSLAERLLKEFRNDVADLDGKRFRCPQFQEVVFRPVSGNFCALMAKSPKHRWISLFADARVQEEDVLAFVDEIKRLRKRVQNKVIIALDGIDQIAKLQAQAQKIQIWSLRDFNALLEIYDLPKVIRFSSISESVSSAALSS